MKRDTKKRFNALLHSFSSKKYGISEAKAQAMSDENKKFMCNIIVRNRDAILSALIPEDPEFISWLNCMGYGYTYTNKQGLQFNGTCAHYVKFSFPSRQNLINTR